MLNNSMRIRAIDLKLANNRKPLNDLSNLSPYLIAIIYIYIFYLLI